MESELKNPYQVITDRVISMLNEGVIPWRKPWLDTGSPKSLQSGKPYRGINIFMLSATSSFMGYSSPLWLTYRQAQSRGGHVIKGEKGTPVVFWKIMEKESEDLPDEEEKTRKIPVLKMYTVFNIQQCEGIEYPTPSVHETPFDPIAQCEQVVQTMPRPPTIRHGESRAYYRPSTDLLNMPAPELFSSNVEYYSTLFHELTHATGHSTRLNRPSITEASSFGSPGYAKEELIAEMGATFLCSQVGIEQKTLENSVSYINNWLKVLRNDPRLIIYAAAAAQKAVDYIIPQESSQTVIPKMAVILDRSWER